MRIRMMFVVALLLIPCWGGFPIPVDAGSTPAA